MLAAGRARGAGMVLTEGEMVSVRQCGSYLFLRYRLLRKESAGSLYDHGHRVAGA